MTPKNFVAVACAQRLPMTLFVMILNEQKIFFILPISLGAEQAIGYN